MTTTARKLVVAAAGAAIVLGVAGILVLRARRGHRPALHLECQPGLTTPGIDVSYYQQTIDWPRVKTAGIQFAFIRLSDGATLKDPMFATNWVEARRAGILRGAYQYFRPDQNVAAQADLMIAAMRGRAADDLPPVIDVEVDAGLGAAVVAERAAAWIARVRAGLGVEPIVYTGSDLWRARGADPLGSQPLWIAHYTQGCPTLPAAWDRWTFWQHTDHGAVPGIEGAVDLDRFSGTLGELRAAP
jgi:lysozyme